MDDLAVHAEQLLDARVISDSYRSVCSGEYLNDDVVSGIILYVRHQLRCWTDSHAKDNTLLCLSTLLLAVKKKLCTNGALLQAMKVIKYAALSLTVSTLCCIAVENWNT